MSFLKIGLRVDVSALQEKLSRNCDLYNRHTERRDAYYSPHAQMSDIWVRYNHPDNKGPHFNDEHHAVWYPEAYEIPEVFDIVFELMRFVKGEVLGGVLITKIPPGGGIAEHVDGGWHAGYFDKFYVPIKNKEGSIFGFYDGVIEAEEGDIYCFNNAVPHWVENNSDEDRISMIVCIKPFMRIF